MKTSVAVAVGTAFLLASGMPWAEDAKAPASATAAMAPQSGSSGGMGSQGQMDEHMQLMKTLHEKIASATTPEARQILMDKQRAEMQDCMAMMDDMKKGDGKKGAMGGGMMEQKGEPPDANAQMQMMQKRLDMMEMMIKAMMDQQEMMDGAKSGVAPPKT